MKSLKKLFQKPKPTSPNYNKIIITAAMQGDIAIVKNCLENGASVNARDDGGATPLIIASYFDLTFISGKNDYEEIISLLIKHGANVNATDMHGNTALMLAASKGLTNRMEILIAAGADLDHLSIDKTSALASARKHNQPTAVKLLEDTKLSMATKKTARIELLKNTPLLLLAFIRKECSLGLLPKELLIDILAKTIPQVSESVSLPWVQNSFNKLYGLFVTAKANANNTNKIVCEPKNVSSKTKSKKHK